MAETEQNIKHPKKYKKKNTKKKIHREKRKIKVAKKNEEKVCM